MCTSLVDQPSSGIDCKVLSYGDVVLYASDLHTLNPGVWLNDNIISFACEYLLSNSSNDIKRQVAIVGAASCELIKHTHDSGIIREIFTSLGVFDKHKVLFVLNDRDDPTVVGGHHWSLLALDRKRGRFSYYDSMRPAKDNAARQFARSIAPYMGATEAVFVVVDCPQQRNSFDCGMYVIEFVRHELKLSEEDSMPLLSSGLIEDQRRRWQEIIYSLSKTQ